MTVPDWKPRQGPRLGYLAWHSDADRRHRAGERQVYCLTCGIWAWPEHVTPGHETQTARQWEHTLRKIEREETRSRQRIEAFASELEDHLFGAPLGAEETR